MTSSAPAIAVNNVSKTLRVPTRRVDTLRERLVAGMRPRTRPLEVLRDITFEVQPGEFFGIAGRNGSGKSTLLKLIAGIYRIDRGEIRVAGRLAPIIELGVGFNNELAAYDNVIMNAVMMGLSPAEARSRYEEIIDFAELEEFEQLQLKNYSSGMRSRLAFAIMVHVDADLLLFDEIFAVGDRVFSQKWMRTFYKLHEAGRTAILVTHSMNLLEAMCRRAFLLEGGRIHTIGTGAEVARAYEALTAQSLGSDMLPDEDEAAGPW